MVEGDPFALLIAFASGAVRLERRTRIAASRPDIENVASVADDELEWVREITGGEDDRCELVPPEPRELPMVVETANIVAGTRWRSRTGGEVQIVGVAIVEGDHHCLVGDLAAGQTLGEVGEGDGCAEGGDGVEVLLEPLLADEQLPWVDAAVADAVIHEDKGSGSPALPRPRDRALEFSPDVAPVHISSCW